MNMLFLSECFPYPPISGGKLRTYNIIKQIKKLNYEIDLLCLTDSKINENEVEHMKRYVKSSKAIIIKKKHPILRILNIMKFKSDKEYLCKSNIFKRHIKVLLKKNDYNFIFCESLWMYQYLYNNKLIDKSKNKLILDVQNVEHEIIYRMMQNNKNTSVIIYSAIENKRIKKLECKYAKDADLFCTVSNRDKEIYIKLYELNEKKVKVIDNGIDISISDNYENSIKSEDKYILFIGSLWYRPNYEGIQWFIKEIWPRIKEINTDLNLRIIGKFEKKIYYEDKDIEFLGFVKDIYTYYKNCAAFIVPLRVGSGTRLKILEAMSFKVPIISTSVGCEGINVINKKNIIICDDPIEFSKEVNDVVNNIYPNMAEEGYNLVKNNYDWNIIGRKLGIYLENV
ncbi:MAG: glycosyltransferase family 4 protein [Eubacteriaceae bacterium]